jgi:hypothetical protein
MNKSSKKLSDIFFRAILVKNFCRSYVIQTKYKNAQMTWFPNLELLNYYKHLLDGHILYKKTHLLNGYKI